MRARIDGVETTFCCIHCASHYKQELNEMELTANVN